MLAIRIGRADHPQQQGIAFRPRLAGRIRQILQLGKTHPCWYLRACTSPEYESVVDDSCSRRFFQEILGEALEDAASLVDAEFFGGVRGRSPDRHFDRFTILAMDFQGSRWRPAMAPPGHVDVSLPVNARVFRFVPSANSSGITPIPIRLVRWIRSKPSAAIASTPARPNHPWRPSPARRALTHNPLPAITISGCLPLHVGLDRFPHAHDLAIPASSRVSEPCFTSPSTTAMALIRRGLGKGGRAGQSGGRHGGWRRN